MTYRQKKLLQYLTTAVIIALIIFLVRPLKNAVGVSDACAVTGILFLITALFRYARFLRFYDLIIFGFLKFIDIWKNDKFSGKDSRTGQYHEFVSRQVHERDYMEAFFTAGVFLLLSAAIANFL